MINPVFAQNFVRKMNRQMGIKINVMNEHGVIIASASPERIGDFHMCAYEIIEQGLNISITEKPTRDLIGVNAPGVNMRLTNNNETIGVIGVSGKPDEVLNLAKMVKLTFETMYEYEYKRKKQADTRDILSQFSYTLILDTPSNPTKISNSAKKLGFRDNYARIPVYLTGFGNSSVLHFLEWYASSSLSRPQDILLPLDQGLLLCKTWNKHEITDLETFINDCIQHIEEAFSSECRFYVAPVQTQFADYHNLYAFFQLLVGRTMDTPQKVYHLTDYLLYFLVQETSEHIRPLLSWFCKEAEKKLDLNQFSETVSGLLQTDMRAEAAAELLHLHKNSVLARVKKIKETLHLSPLTSTKDAVLLMAVYEMLNGKG